MSQPDPLAARWMPPGGLREGALPPWVILDGVDPKRMLGPTGWVIVRRLACSFNTEGEAKDWLAAARKQTPALFAGGDAKVTCLQRKPTEAQAATTRQLADYEPFGHEADEVP